MNRTSCIAGIVLAAGESARMGRTKQLLPFRDRTVVECVVAAALASSLSYLVVVLGHEAEHIRPLLRGKNLVIAVNPDYADGQSSSLKTGLRALTEETEAVLFLLGDQPLITPECIDLILSAYRTSPAPIVLPVYAGRRGNPALFSRETFPHIATLSGDCGARAIFEKYADRILTLPVADPAIHFDIDTEEDYRSLLRLPPARVISR